MNKKRVPAGDVGGGRVSLIEAFTQSLRGKILYQHQRNPLFIVY